MSNHTLSKNFRFEKICLVADKPYRIIHTTIYLTAAGLLLSLKRV